MILDIKYSETVRSRDQLLRCLRYVSRKKYTPDYDCSDLIKGELQLDTKHYLVIEYHSPLTSDFFDTQTAMNVELMRSKIVSKEVLEIFDLIVQSDSYTIENLKFGEYFASSCYIRQMKDGKREGYVIHLTWFDDRISQSVTAYKDNEAHGISRHYTDEVLHWEGTYVNGVLEPEVRTLIQGKMVVQRIGNSRI